MIRRGMWLVGLLLVAAVASAGCVGLKAVSGSGDPAEETREVSDFRKVELATLGTLYIEVGERETLRIEADDNLLPYLETEVRGDTLKIASRDMVGLLPKEPIYYYLTVRTLDEIVLSGLGSIEVPAPIETPALAVRISGGGSVELEDLRAETFDADLTGLGDLYVDEGVVEAQDVLISGGGNYRARGLESEQATVRVTGLGSATVRVSERLDVTISGGGSVRYIGSPSVTQDVSGLGRVEQVED
ncbi:MAG: DUF2807 domain-containing protein [Anaerolineae bacterium]|nr:DUF2807 domain-containing protein [Anaerolineae bacterium]